MLNFIVCQLKNSLLDNKSLTKSYIYKNSRISLTVIYSQINQGNEDNQNLSTPGKIILSSKEIKEREQKLKILSETWRQNRIKKEEIEKRLFGFSKNSEILNGRLAMFFIVTGLLTEYWTKQNILNQIETILRTLGLF